MKKTIFSDKRAPVQPFFTPRRSVKNRCYLLKNQIVPVFCVLGSLTAVLTFAPTVYAEADGEALTAQSYQQTLEELTSTFRWAGTPEEQEAAQEIADRLSGYVLEVTQQTFTFTESPQGKQTTGDSVNIIAVKPADTNPTDDILIVSAHYDSKECTTGANDNASGEALLLELARVLKDVPSDTEIRFISFSAEEEGLRGSRAYVESLSQEEKEHIIGDIQLDMIGHYRSTTSNIATAFGNEELLGQMLADASAEITGQEWETIRDAASDHASFSFAGIPAVEVEQEATGEAENHRFIDNISIIDADKAVETGKVIESVIRQVASEETGSLAEEAQSMTPDDTAISIENNTPILFAVDKPTVEVKIGAAATFEKDSESEYGYEQSHYILNTRWFDWEPLVTDFVYRKDDVLTLDQVFIRTASLGLSDEELGEKLTEALGEPQVYDGGSSIWGSDSMAENPSLRQYMISQQDGEQVIEVTSFIHQNVGEDIQSYDFKAADQDNLEGDAADQAVLEAVRKIVPADDPYITSVISWTDGYSYVLGSCMADDIAKSDSFSIRIDKNDFFNADGTMINESKYLATAIHEYGHALTLNESQMNTDLLTDYADYNDMTLYKDDSYMKAFYDQFYADGKQRDFYENPEDYVSDYAGTAGVFEDIAESFMQFVIGDRQEGDSLAAQKINFFYDYSAMTEARNYIRQNFGYSVEVNE